MFGFEEAETRSKAAASTVLRLTRAGFHHAVASAATLPSHHTRIANQNVRLYSAKTVKNWSGVNGNPLAHLTRVIHDQPPESDLGSYREDDP